jgi:hypothetical protein
MHELDDLPPVDLVDASPAGEAHHRLDGEHPHDTRDSAEHEIHS